MARLKYTLFLLGALLWQFSTVAQLADMSFWVRSGNITSYENYFTCGFWEGPCWEVGDEEYTGYAKFRDNVNTALASTSCQTCNANGDCTYAVNVFIGSRTNNAYTITGNMDAWEDDTDPRCTFNGSGGDADDCRRNGDVGSYNLREWQFPGTSYVAGPTWGTCSNSHTLQLQSYWNYANGGSSLTPCYNTLNVGANAGAIRSWRVAMTAGETYVFSTCGLTTEDTYLRLFGTDGRTVLVNADDQCGTQSELVYTAPSSGTYYIELSRWSRNALNSSMSMNYYKRRPGSNSAFAFNAGTLACGTTYSNTQNNSTGNCFGNAYEGRITDDIWYQFTLSQQAWVDIGTCGSDFDTWVTLLNSSLGFIANNDDNGPLCSGTRASLRVLLSAGTYFVVSEGFSGAGNITTTITPSTPSAGTTSGPSAVCAGASGIVYTHTGASSATSYNWTLPPGAAIVSGAGTNSITVNFGSSGGGVNVQVRNYTGSGVCQAATSSYTVSVSAQPVITADPSSATLCNGGSHNLSVTRSGGALSSLQWQYFNGSSWVAVSNGTPTGASYVGATSNSMTVSGITASGAFQYRAQVTDTGPGCNSPVNSATATVTVQPAVSRGTVNGTAETLCFGGDPSLITMSTGASGGSGSFSYQWYFRDGVSACPTGSGISAGWTLIPGATSPSYDPPSGLTTTRTYALRVDPLGSPDCGVEEWASNCRVVTVLPNLNRGTVNNTPQTICFGGDPSNITMSTSASGGAGTFTYQWYFQDGTPGCPAPGSGTGGWTAISGATSMSYDPPAGLTTTRTYALQVDATGSPDCGGDDWAGNCRVVTVQPIVDRGTVNNSAETICPGGDPANITMSSLPSGGAGTFAYQWFFQNGTPGCPAPGSGFSGWTNISGATTDSYDPPAGLTTTRTYALRVDPTGSPDCGAADWASSCRVVTVQPTVNRGTVNNTAETICFGGDPANITMSAAPSGGAGTFDYQWYFQDGTPGCPAPGSGTSGWTAISGATTNSYDPPSGLGVTRTYALQVDATGSPDCAAFDWAGSCRTITVVPDPNPPTATKSPNVAGVCEGTTLTITGVTDAGGGTGTCNIEYRFNTGSGFGAWSGSVPSFAAVEGTNVIEVRKNCSGNGCDPATNSFFWTVAANPTASNAGADQGNCNSDGFTLAGNNPTVGFGVWSVVSGTAAISVPTSPFSPVTGVPLGTSATLRWTISSGACPPSMDDVVLTNETPPSSAVITSTDYTCSGSTFELVGANPAVGDASWSKISGPGTLTPDLALPRLADLNAIPINSTVEVRYTISNGPGANCPDATADATLDFLTSLATPADADVTCTPIPTGGTQYWASDDGEKLYIALDPNGENLGATTVELPGSDAFSTPASYFAGLDTPNGAYGGGGSNPARMTSGKPTCPDELFFEDIFEISVANQPTNNDPELTIYIPKTKWDDFVTNGNTWLDAVAGRRTDYFDCYGGFPAATPSITPPSNTNVVVTGYHEGSPLGRTLHLVSDVTFVSAGDYYAVTFTTDRFSSFVLHGAGSWSPLPVQLVSFTGQQQNGVNFLDWVTATEFNVSHFEVERSTDGISFSKIGSVEAAGNSTATRTYQFPDRTAPAGGNYYRLRMVDLDGSFEYSNVVYLSKGQSVAISQYIQVVPNPFTDKFEVEFYQAQPGTYNVKVTDLAGRPVRELERHGDSGLISVPLDLTHEAAGSYLIQVQRQDGMRLVKQVVKSTD
jgi:hypothetical protein